MKIIVSLFLSAVFLVSCPRVEQNDAMKNQLERNEILASFIMDQWTFEGTRLQLFLHAAVPDASGLSFELLAAPPWVHISNKETRATIIMDTPMESEGEYDISVAIKQGNRLTQRNFTLEVQKRFDNILFIDPLNGKNENDGSEAAPLAEMPDFSTMEDAEGTLLILLKSGVYETLIINHNLGLKLTIQPLSGNGVLFEGAKIDSCSYVSIRSCSFIANPDNESRACIEIGTEATNTLLENIHAQTALNTEEWDYDKWKQNEKFGVYNFGKNTVVSSSLMDNIFHGLENNASHFNLHHSIIDRFTGDGIRNTGSNSSFVYNMIKNAMISDYSAPEGNHDDLFQSWTFDEPITNVLLSHNIGIDIVDNNMKLPADTIQGFACFDGFTIDWTIEDNLILLDHPHGIALFGNENCTIKDNIVARNPFKRQVFESEPWIMIHSHKDGRPSSHSIIQDNLTAALRIEDSTALIGGNVVMDSLYEKYFIDYHAWDFRLKTVD